MTNSAPSVRQRNRRKRLIEWIAIYIAIFAAFLVIIFWQSGKVNTLGFPAGQILLSVSKSKYTVGQTVAFTITNDLSNAITLVDNCPNEPLHVYQWESNQWVRIHAQAKSSNCNNQANRTVIQPHATLTRNYANWPQLFAKPGIYRLVAFADNYTALPYVDFQVVGKNQSAAPTIIYQTIYTPIYVNSEQAPTGGDN